MQNEQCPPNWITPEATAQAETHVLRNKKATVVLAFKCQHAFAHGFIFKMNMPPSSTLSPL